MTIKTIRKVSSEVALASIRDEISGERTLSKTPATASPASRRGSSSDDSVKASPSLPASVLEMWTSLPLSVRKALVSTELSGSLSSATSTSATTLSQTSASASEDGSSDGSSNAGSSSNGGGAGLDEIHEECPDTGASVVLRPLERAPHNVFEFSKTQASSTVSVEKTSSATVTTTTKVVSTMRGWRNVFNLPISYDVNMVPHGTILDPSNMQLLHATGPKVEGYNRRFAVIDDQVDRIYGERIRAYFVALGIELTAVVINGGEADKRPDAVDKLLDDLCAYKLRRREPFLAIGGGVLLDIAGMAACLYRRGVPFVRVPTTLLAIVDASVGVKNGVDYCCGITDETYKNRVGSFYAPSSCLLDASFISTQDARNISNGFGEIMKLALVRSTDLFELLECHGAALVESRFGPNPSTPEGVSDRIIDLSIQIMLEELGPNLWETKLDRCVDYGHTFSKLLEMVPGADIMHGEAVNVDGFFCVVLSHLRGYIAMDTVNRVFAAMKSLALLTDSSDLKSDLAWQSCKDAVEHRHGEQRIPLITEIGESICVSDITPEELDRAIEMMKQFDH
uniref:3-dehydroquinate synthase domain-containing protein n=1 Tax=Odontella aurita TaxID=265563 RepID=A0A7S4NEJ8_9STRA|mmetsp:Transcript_59831/g.177311  ORF Transcript_59831/g.177311 Transcript_59831/m.177311 type:complete len:567 (+) Transcript_59831:372-2072(+)|eukprot:CAMPEP_0113553538 /NCGR_PEP_ID=MMETSP0015_2-20120614/15667_1 /TAXON_ID=2838 /ORGANISM="Odontella" /LENGTH=566 /DNA_ID=CAMNT_0000454615 /DNA_START=359 /DNA_END=2059 /DNA_ORIENTATION=- /assembly_acc=CAM_ASM_000160